VLKQEFLKKVALTLELSLKMAEDWLERIEPDNLEERQRLDEYKHQIKELLDDVGELTKEAHSQYEVEKLQEKVADVAGGIINEAD
jgi:hypothetical protein